jgi:hypothetical protein
MLHYVFLTFDSPGHVAGIINLADKLLKIHPEIKSTVYIKCSFKGKWGTTDVSDEPVPGLRVIKLRLQPDGDHRSAPFDYALENPNEIGDILVEAIEKDINSTPGIPPPSIICTDHFGSTWGYRVAKKMKIKSYIYMPTPILFWSVLRLLPEALTHFERKGRLEIPHYGSLGHLQLPQKWDTLELLYTMCNLVRVHDGMLINDQEETYSQEYVSSIKEYVGNVWFIGYLPPIDIKAPSCNNNENDAVLQWLNHQQPKSVIYIALGTEASFCRADRVELAFALENVGCPVIWSLKKIQKDASYRPIHADADYKEREPKTPCDEYGLPEGWRERMGDGVMILEWAPQIRILSHPSTALFISHCGWNSLLECISTAGIPIVGVPMLSDQPINGDMMEKKLKIGKNLWNNPAEGELDRDTAATVIRETMNDEQLIKNAANLKKLNHGQFNSLSDSSTIKRLDDFFNKSK